MKSETLSVTIDAPPDHVFQFVSNLENLPRWAVNFCRGVRRNGDSWTVTTTGGQDAEICVNSDVLHRVVDFHWKPSARQQAFAPTRVVADGHGSQYLFTLFQSPGMPEEEFQAGKQGLAQELRVLKGLLEECDEPRGNC